MNGHLEYTYDPIDLNVIFFNIIEIWNSYI